MGRKGYNVTEKIENEFNNGVKSGKEIKEIIIEKLGKNTPQNINKTVDEKLIKLLEDKKIKIVGYRPEDDSRKPKSRQNFKSDPILFDSTERLTRPDIKKLLRHMEDDNDSYQNIRELFKTRYIDFYSLQIRRWDYMKKWIFYATPYQIKEYLKQVYPNLKEIENEYKNLDNEKEKEIFSKLENFRGIIRTYRSVEKGINVNINRASKSNVYKSYIGALLKTLSKYEDKKNVKVWFYPYTSEKCKRVLSFNNYVQSVLTDFCCEFDSLPDFNTPDGEKILLNAVDVFISCPYKIDIEGKWDKFEALRNAGFRNANILKRDSDLAFEHVIDIMFTYPNKEREILNGILAKGLSNEPGSFEIFEDFCNEIIRVNYTTRVKNVLGTLSDL